MISERHFNTLRKDCFCQTPELIENYEQAVNDKEQIWECHHRDEIRTLPSGMIVIRSKEELIENGRYYNCPPNELIFLTKEEHVRIHNFGKNFGNTYAKGNTNNRGKTFSEFGEKFKEHFGITSYENIKLYQKEHQWYKNHNRKCRWEV